MFLLFLTTLAVSGTEYCNALLRVLDETTGAPVVGVEVATVYWNDAKESFTPRESKGTTNQKGQVLLEVYRDAFTPRASGSQSRAIDVLFRFAVDNGAYREDGELLHPIWGTEQAIFARPADSVPSEPDHTFRIRSLSEKQRLEKLRKVSEVKNEKQAAEWLKKTPGFWPPQADEMWPNPAEQLLVTKRWEIASSKPLGSVKELAAIETAILANLPQGEAAVREVRWLSDSVVIAECGWHSGPLNAGAYLFVLKKMKGRWVVFRKYLQVIS